MKNMNNKSGFTLIEIIVVLIIIGILAAIALPNLFSNIAKSKGGAVLSTFDAYKTALEAYYAKNSGNTPATADLATNNLATSIVAGGTTFNVTITGVSALGTYSGGTLVYSLTATDAAATGNTINLVRASAGTWTCTAITSGPYAGVC